MLEARTEPKTEPLYTEINTYKLTFLIIHDCSRLVGCRPAERYHELAVNAGYGSLGDGSVEVVAFSVRPEGLRLLCITINICASVISRLIASTKKCND